MTEAANEKRREYAARWREANRERIRLKAAAWRAANPDKVREQQERYWEKKAQERML